jgi:radical SAM protein with 4Fe4S-binding SPASM domain
VDWERHEGLAHELAVRYVDYGPVQGETFARLFDESGVRHYLERLEKFYAARVGRFAQERLKLVSAPADALKVRFGHRITKKCGAGHSFVSVGAEGEVNGCWVFQNDPTLQVGNIHDEAPLSRVKLNVFSDLINPHASSLCSGCWARNICGGHCGAMRHNKEAEFRRRCGYLRRLSGLYVGLQHAMSASDRAYIRGLHFDH